MEEKSMEERFTEGDVLGLGFVGLGLWLCKLPEETQYNWRE